MRNAARVYMPLIAVGLLSCAQTTDPLHPTLPLGVQVIELAIHDGIGNVPFARDDLTIVRARVVAAHTLEIEVRYGGGCHDHAFVLLASSGFLESNPVQAVLALAHDAKGDACGAIITKTLHVDLTQLRELWQEQYQQGSGVIDLPLDGIAVVRYTF